MQFLKSKKQKVLNNSGFNDLKDFLNYLTSQKIKYKCIIDSNGNWCASVGGQSVKRYLKDEIISGEINENDNINNN